MRSASNRRDIYVGNVDTPAGRNLKSRSCFRAFLFDDHLSFAAYFQPNLIVAVLIGKISASICAIVLAICLLRRKPRNLSRIMPALPFND